MGLGPKQMGEAILRNLEKKTGKNSTQWVSLVKETGLTAKKEVIHYLKTTHGLGHFQAQKIFDVMVDENAYSNTDGFATELFGTKHTMKLYQQMKEKILDLGSDVREQPCKTYIPFYSKHQFAVLKARQNQLVLGLNLSRGNARFLPSNNLGSSARMNYQTTIASEKDIDDLVVATLKEAYENNR